LALNLGGSDEKELREDANGRPSKAFQRNFIHLTTVPLMEEDKDGGEGGQK